MNNQQGMPSFVFRLTEIFDVSSSVDSNGNFAPSCGVGSNEKISDGTLWLCDGFQVHLLANTGLHGLRLKHYHTSSMYYIDGKGFMVMTGDATSAADEVWLPLCFEHDKGDSYSSYLTNAKEHPALLCRREDQLWVKMLLPDVNHGSTVTHNRNFGALKGDLPIFLALIAFSIPRDLVQTDLPSMFQDGKWKQCHTTHGRVHRRGVMIEVFTYWHDGGSSGKDLADFENGLTGKYYS